MISLLGYGKVIKRQENEWWKKKKNQKAGKQQKYLGGEINIVE